MLRKLLEKSIGQISNSEFKEILGLATTDIKANHIDFGKRTSLSYAVGIAEICCTVLRR